MVRKAPPETLPDGEYIAKCRQLTIISAAANGHLSVWPEAKLVIKGRDALFYKEGMLVWSCNVAYAATHFDVTSLKTGP